jgi:hypothetical protein
MRAEPRVAFELGPTRAILEEAARGDIRAGSDMCGSSPAIEGEVSSRHGFLSRESSAR